MGKVPIGACGVLVAILAGCGDANESYTRLHDAAASKDGHTIAILAETGRATLRGNTFSATWDYAPRELSVWHLYRANGTLRRVKTLEPPAGFKGFYSSPKLAELFADEVDGMPSLPNCVAELTRCAAERAPDAFVIRDITGNRDRGLMVIDPAAGKRVRGERARLIDEPWTLGTGAAIEAAALQAMRSSVSRVFDAATERLRASLATTGGMPTARSETFIDSTIAEALPGLMPEYSLDAGGVVNAVLSYAEEVPARFRWTPAGAPGKDGMPGTFTCEVDRADAAAWFDECTFSARPESLDPELVYLASRIPEMQASAATDATYRAARKGLTFGVRHHNPAVQEVWVACLGLPGTRRGQCDSDEGDTECGVALPLLCVRPDPTLNSPYDGSVMQERWFAAHVAASTPVRGSELASAEAADARCEREFGADWRMARWSDHGEGFIARGDIDTRRRLWVNATEASDADCWD